MFGHTNPTVNRSLMLSAMMFAVGFVAGCVKTVNDGAPGFDASSDIAFGPVQLIPLTEQAPARLIVGTPVPEQLALGRVVIPYRTENLRIMPVYGQAALQVSPRVGHLHLTVDDGPWRWVDASGEPLIINKLSPGPHTILVELADPVHRVIDSVVVRFEVPKTSSVGH